MSEIMNLASFHPGSRIVVSYPEEPDRSFLRENLGLASW